MTLEYLKSVLSGIDNFNEEEPEEDVTPKSDIYDIMKILDRHKKEDGLKKIYKTDFHYDRNGNSISLIFKIDNFRRSGDFDKVFSSQYVQDMLNELSELNISKTFLKRLKNKLNYKLSLHGNIGIYQTPYYRILNN